MKRLIAAAVAVIVVSLGGAAGVSAANLSGTDCPICQAGMVAQPGPLNQSEVEGLLLALNDEYRAWAIYDQVIKDFGEVRPFSTIRSSEAQHISVLVGLFNVYGVMVPENPWPGNVPHFGSPREAAAAGMAAEVDNGALYDRLFSSTDRADILQVYSNLQRASMENHLPAFERASSGAAGGGSGPAWSR